MFVSDDCVATVGSVNLDFRSLFLHFENGVLLYDREIATAAEEDFQQTLAKSERIYLKTYGAFPLYKRAFGRLMRVFGPWMYGERTMVSKNMLRVIIILLGILIALPVWQLSGMLLWGLLCGVTTMLVLDICLLRPYPVKAKLVFLGIYVLTMVCVVIWLLV